MSDSLTREEAPASKLDFSRFEFKYLLNANRRAALESDLQHFLQYDPFVVLRENHQYPVRSLILMTRAIALFTTRLMDCTHGQNFVYERIVALSMTMHQCF